MSKNRGEAPADPGSDALAPPTARASPPQPPDPAAPSLSASNPAVGQNRNKEAQHIAAARETLQKAGVQLTEGLITVTDIATAIRQTIHAGTRIPKTTADAMLAIATLLQSVQTNQIIEEIANHLTETVSAPLDRLTEIAENARQTLERLENATIAQTNTTADIRNRTRETTDLIGSAAVDLAERAEAALRTITHRAPDTAPPTLTPLQPTQGTPPPPNAPETYANALRNGTQRPQQIRLTQPHPGHAEAIAMTQDRARQVIIHTRPRADIDGQQSSTQAMTEHQLIDKANEAVERMGAETEGRPNNERIFVGAQPLRRGAILYLTASEEAAQWLQQSHIRQAFTGQYEDAIQIRERGYDVILEYVPVTFDPDSRDALTTIEQDNNLPTAEIAEAKYIKDVARRTPGQRTAFVLMSFRNPQHANRTISQGLVIEGKKIQCRKSIYEPRRCMKCQAFTPFHFAVDCKWIHDVCPRCAGPHKITECTASPNQKSCHNCQAHGHAASDHDCPTFKRECHKIMERRPENRYRYFPVNEDPATWERTGAEATLNNERENNTFGGFVNARLLRRTNLQEMDPPQWPPPDPRGRITPQAHWEDGRRNLQDDRNHNRDHGHGHAQNTPLPPFRPLPRNAARDTAPPIPRMIPPPPRQARPARLPARPARSERPPRPPPPPTPTPENTANPSNTANANTVTNTNTNANTNTPNLPRTQATIDFFFNSQMTGNPPNTST